MTSKEEVIRQEYIDALDAFRAATKRLHIARQAFNTLAPVIPWHVGRQDAVKRVREMYAAGEQDTAVLAVAVNRSRQWVRHELRVLAYREQQCQPDHESNITPSTRP